MVLIYFSVGFVVECVFGFIWIVFFVGVVLFVVVVLCYVEGVLLY